MKHLLTTLALSSLGFVHAQDRPNIVWITSEDNSTTFVGCYGNELARTPNIDALAKRGVRYTNAFASAPASSPARSTLITGVYPTSMGTQHMRSYYPIPDEIKLFPKYLQEAGYYCINSGKMDYNIFNQGEKPGWNEVDLKANIWIDKRPKDKPFFFVQNFGESHESAVFENKDKLITNPNDVQTPPYLPDTKGIREDRARYYDRVEAVDKRVGQVIQKLEEEGLAENTIIFYYADNGGVLGRSKRFLYDEGLHVPLIIYFPEKYKHLAPAKPGETIDDLVSFIDFAPTMLNMLGIEIPKHMQGQPFLGKNTPAARKYVYAARGRMGERIDCSYAVRDKRFKYIRNYGAYYPWAQHINFLWRSKGMQEWEKEYLEGRCTPAQARFFETKPVEELYDLENDKHEIHNLAKDANYSSILEEMRQQHKAWSYKYRDAGLLIETEADERSKQEGLTTYELIRSEHFPYDELYKMADVATFANPNDFDKIKKGLSSADAAIRRWAVVGCIMQAEKAQVVKKELMDLAIKDESVFVRITASEALYVLGEKKRSQDILFDIIKNEKNAHTRLYAYNVVDRMNKGANELRKKIIHLYDDYKGSPKRDDVQIILYWKELIANTQTYPFQDTTLSFVERATDLVSRLTLKEKVSQMVNSAPAIPRLNVPAYRWWSECGHGVARSGNATLFPQNIGLAASFDEDLIFRMTDAISDEARMLYNQAKKYGNDGKYTGLSYYSPSINIYRDPRWGRGQETFGEDPYLTSRLGVAYIKGLQGDDPRYLKAGACAKHFAAHSGPEQIKFGFGAQVEWQDLYETYFPAFKAAVKEANVESVMGAYSRMNGEPGASSKFLLSDVLREEWGFTGYTTSDCGAVARLVSSGAAGEGDGEGSHSIARTLPEACAIALKNGLNLECGGVFLRNLPTAVQKGYLKEELIDQRLIELMVSRFKLGMFDDESKIPYNQVPADIINSKKHIDLAYETAVKSLVLLENKNNLLPLGKDVNYVYVTGPLGNSSDALIGNYYGASDKMTTFYEGIAGRMPLGMSIQYRPGVMLDHKGYNDWTVREAPEADVIVACVGLTNMFEGEGTDAIASKTKGDMYDLQIPEAQLNFIRTLRKNIEIDKHNKSPKLVVVVASGTPLILTELRELADAVIYAWYPGQAGGYALADVLFGKVSPSGRTPMTFVKSLDQLPAFIDYKMSSGRTYKFMKEEPLYPFGYGLSYATFEYSALQAPKVIKAGEVAKISVKIKNTSSIKADEIVQVYASTEEAGVGETPIRRLADFQRVSLKPNETKTITLEIKPESISYLKGKKQRIVEAGEVRFSVGGGQPLSKTAAFVEGSFKVKGKETLEL